MYAKNSLFQAESLGGNPKKVDVNTITNKRLLLFLIQQT